VKRLGVLPVITDPNDKPGNEALRDKVIGSDRMQFARDATIQKTLKKLPVKQFSFSDKDLFAFADSALENKRPPAPLAVRGTTQLFSIGNQVFTAADFLTYAQSWRYKADGSGVKPYSQVLDEFRRHAAEDYYRAHLEEFNPEFKSQMNEFRDGNLFFEIMQREVWGKAQTDTVALAKYYQQSRSKYLWKESADAIIFFCSDETSGKALYDQVKKTPANWKALAAAFAEKVVTDSSRYELPQIPNPGKLALQAGTITAPLQNATDNSVSFAYVLKLYPANEPRNFNDAKGLVINDYQADLDREWIAELKKKYPVVIDEKVLAAISK
jgi:peptidyl-prolyl cis-trans isomerase SurA